MVPHGGVAVHGEPCARVIDCACVDAQACRPSAPVLGEDLQEATHTDTCARTQCPIMLGMVSNMALIKYKSQPLNPIMVAAAIIRTVFGISATVRELCLAVHGLFCVAGR